MKHVIMCFVASLLLSLVSIPMLAQQQSRLISGIVKDESGEPMIGASVLDVSTKQGTIADIDGKFTLEVTSSSKLQISFVGYKDQIISGKDLKKDMIIVLKSNTEMIDELVVVGYGTQKKAHLTGAIATVPVDEIQDISSGSLANTLSGLVNGVSVSGGDTRPGETARISIRQNNVLTEMKATNVEPLYVIDISIRQKLRWAMLQKI